MYTVLIVSKKTMNSLQQFYPILAEAIEEEQIGVCQWVESGTTVDTAMPELYEQISRKRMWRAVVVCAERDEVENKYPADSINPFDFLENMGRDGLTIVDGELIDCEAPLIRLTHMLGGFPTPEPKFTSRIVEQENMVPRMEYVLSNDDEMYIQKKAYEQWNENHAFQGLPPAEIVLVKIRSAAATANVFSRVRASWKVHTEADSSEFWKRNLYPHNCRFIVYDMDKRGVLRQQQDYFKFWTAMLLISQNEIDPNVLQAHRLYNLNIILDDVALTKSFQQTINKINMAKYQLQKGIARDEEEMKNEEAEIPEFEVHIPISFQFPKASDIHFDAREYGLTGGAESGDLANWEIYRQGANKELKKLLQSTNRTLDQATSRLRGLSTYAESDVIALSKYQEEDFTLSLAEIYGDMLREQAALPGDYESIEEKLEGANEKVRKNIIQRASRKQAWMAAIISILAVAVCFAPGLIYEQTRWATGLMLLVVAFVLGIAELAILITQKKTLIERAKNYQLVFQDTISEVSHNASLYSDFFSNVASHVHGSSYINQMRQKRIKRDTAYYFKQKHIKAIDMFLSKLSLWSTAFHLDVDLKSVEAIELADDEPDSINYDSLYSFDVGKDFVVPLNHIGIDIASPFGFIERLEIEREEVYDDDK